MFLIVLSFDPYLIIVRLILIFVKHYFSISVNINGLLGASEIFPSNKFSNFYIPLSLRVNIIWKFSFKLAEYAYQVLWFLDMYHNFRSRTFHFPL
uniref:Uncharacterized protein n=1 Tax=Triticum urartu TaxID=4572 RepID=A0A8R7U9A8_TRIUA